VLLAGDALNIRRGKHPSYGFSACQEWSQVC
jgi:hypothetical protein